MKPRADALSPHDAHPRRDNPDDITRQPPFRVAAQAHPSEESWTALLFTDLVGSTSLWQLDAPAMAHALAAHDYALNQLAKQCKGRVFKTAGDAIMATFPSVAEALHCAINGLALLHRLDRETPSCPLGDRIRLVVHAGRVYLRDGDCFGEEVCYGSRLVSSAPPRAILVTEAALMAVDRSIFPRLQFEAYRTGPLKDFSHERRVYRILDGSDEQALRLAAD